MQPCSADAVVDLHGVVGVEAEFSSQVLRAVVVMEYFHISASNDVVFRSLAAASLADAA